MAASCGRPFCPEHECDSVHKASCACTHFYEHSAEELQWPAKSPDLSLTFGMTWNVDWLPCRLFQHQRLTTHGHTLPQTHPKILLSSVETVLAADVSSKIALLHIMTHHIGAAVRCAHTYDHIYFIFKKPVKLIKSLFLLVTVVVFKNQIEFILN